jgi:RND family efflux transporter MFP subunit
MWLMHRWHPILWSMALCLSSVAGCARTEAEGSGAEEHHPAPVKVVIPRTEKLGEWTELLGTTQPLPDRIARVSAAVEGHVHSILESGVTEGGTVKAGQLIVHLDDRVARANLEKFERQRDELDEQKKQAQIAVELAMLEVTRLEELGRSTGATPLLSQFEKKKADLALKDAKSRQDGLDKKRASLQAEIDALKAQLDFYSLRTPITGQLGAIQVAVGQTITPGTSVAEVVDLSKIDVLCFVPPGLVHDLKVGQPARLAGNEKATGELVYLSVQGQSETGSFAAKVRFPNQDKEHALPANLVQRLRVLTEPEKDRLVIPEAALQEDQDPPVVVIVQKVKTKKEDKKEEKLGEALQVAVTIGVRDREHGLVEVLGLKKKEGEEHDEKEKKEKEAPIDLKSVLIVVEGGQGLHDGDEVKIEEDKPKEETSKEDKPKDEKSKEDKPKN